MSIGIKRETLQKKAVEEISNTYFKDGNIFLGEYGTGNGKSKILLDSAFNMFNKTNKSVIVSTLNNNLILQLLETANKFGMDKSKIKIMIGSGNYVDSEIVLSDDFLADKNFSKDDVLNWLDDTSNYNLVSSFLETFNLHDIYSEIIGVDNTGSKKVEELTLDSRVDLMEKEPMIYITNHIYLLCLYRNVREGNNKSIEFYDSFVRTPVLLDEVHGLHDAASTLFSKRFSVFKLMTSLRACIKSTEISKANIRQIKKVNNIISGLVNDKAEFSDDYSIDFYLSLNENDEIKKVKELIKKINTPSKMKKYNHNTARAIIIIAKELSILSSLTYAKRNELSISYSPTKKFPSIEKHDDNPAYKIRKHFQVKNKGYIAGISGTLKIADSNDKDDNIWSFERIGFVSFKNIPMSELSKDEKAYHFRVNTQMVFKVEDSIFSRKQALHHIMEDVKYKYPNFSKLRDNQKKKAEENWVKGIAECVTKSLYGNMLVLMSSFDNCKMLHDELEKMKDINDELSEYEVLYSKEGESTNFLQKKHMDNVDKGKKSILIGGLNFYTGIDMKGSYIDVLLIGKLPFEPIRSKTLKFHGFNSFKNSKGKALLSFRQGFGRSIRTENDECFINICDSRILEPKNKDFLYFLEKFSANVKEIS